MAFVSLISTTSLALSVHHVLIFQSLLGFKRPQDDRARPLPLGPCGLATIVRSLGTIPRCIASPCTFTWVGEGFHAWDGQDAITFVQGDQPAPPPPPWPQPIGIPLRPPRRLRFGCRNCRKVGKGGSGSPQPVPSWGRLGTRRFSHEFERERRNFAHF